MSEICIKAKLNVGQIEPNSGLSGSANFIVEMLEIK